MKYIDLEMVTICIMAMLVGFCIPWFNLANFGVCFLQVTLWLRMPSSKLLSDKIKYIVANEVVVLAMGVTYYYLKEIWMNFIGIHR